MLSESQLLLVYFIAIILVGAFLLLLPGAWTGPEPLQVVDALFTSTSAVCVTGLITLDTARFSLFGKLVILFCIQFGGLGIITFSTLYMMIPSRKISLKSRKIIKEYFLDDIEYDPVVIVKQIIFITLLIEVAGAVVLYFAFSKIGDDHALFNAIFHSISAFCNAGFSSFSNNLESFYNNPTVVLTILVLIICGGLGFLVFRDLLKNLVQKNKNFTLHTKMVIFTSLCLIVGGTIILFVSEYNHLHKFYSFKDQFLMSLFQAVTPRTAGFNTVPIDQMQPISLSFITILMFIGAAPGSTGGGVKVTTFFIIMLLLFKRLDNDRRITIFNRKINANTLFTTTIFLLKAFFIFICSVILVYVSETLMKHGVGVKLFPIIFECCSAFGTVGLSLGITSSLAWVSKLIIIVTMLFGRVGLMIMLLGILDKKDKNIFNYPEEEVLIA